MRTKAFTLIELAVVLLVIGILAGIVLRNIGSQGIQARDIKRVSDLRNVNVYLAQYLSKTGQFPASTDKNWSATNTTGVGNGSLSAALKSQKILSTDLPVSLPPIGASYEYYACSDQGVPNPDETDVSKKVIINHFILRAKLEQSKADNSQLYEGSYDAGKLPSESQTSGWQCHELTGVGATIECTSANKNYCLAN
jgi:prepilin-type N-terminal cleavage/methylation domain-containing protein